MCLSIIRHSRWLITANHWPFITKVLWGDNFGVIEVTTTKSQRKQLKKV